MFLSWCKYTGFILDYQTNPQEIFHFGIFNIRIYICSLKNKKENGQDHTFTFISPSDWSLA